jgi:hypothetical protein
MFHQSSKNFSASEHLHFFLYWDRHIGGHCVSFHVGLCDVGDRKERERRHLLIYYYKLDTNYTQPLQQRSALMILQMHITNKRRRIIEKKGHATMFCFL